jgi:hypothetical protein
VPGGSHGIIPAPGAGSEYNRYLGIVLAELSYILSNNLGHNLHILSVGIQISKLKRQCKSKCLNAKTTWFHYLDFDFDLTFGLCHLTLS